MYYIYNKRANHIAIDSVLNVAREFHTLEDAKKFLTNAGIAPGIIDLNFLILKDAEPSQSTPPPPDQNLTADFETMARTVIKYLNDNHHPHTTLIANLTSVEVCEGIKTLHTEEYLKD